MNKIYPKFRGTLKKGRLHFDSGVKGSFDRYMLTQNDGLYDVSVKPHSDKKMRSNEQNRYYFGCILPLLSEHLGYTIDEIHELMKYKFIKKKYTINKEDIYIGESTTKLATVRMEAYFSYIRTWSSMELGCYIPLPNEVDVE